MSTCGKRVLRDPDPLKTLVAIFVLSVLMSNAVESRLCFNINDISSTCIANVKAEHGLNQTGYGALGIKSDLGRVYTYGCFQLALEDSVADCIDSSFLATFYACIFNNSAEAKEALQKVNVTSLQQAVDIGNAFVGCFKSRPVSWRQDFLKRPTGKRTEQKRHNDFRLLRRALAD
ncbi:uncharacterized protein LOC144150091 [Haemaphysalis longicornis]